jgi:putative sterol carrier protein
MPDITVQELILAQEKAFLPEKAAGVEAVVQYRLTGEDGGDWVVTIKDEKCTVEQGIAVSPKLTLTAKAHDFREVMLGKVDGMMAFMQGKLKLTGDLNLAMKLNGFFKR